MELSTVYKIVNNSVDLIEFYVKIARYLVNYGVLPKTKLQVIRLNRIVRLVYFLSVLQAVP